MNVMQFQLEALLAKLYSNPDIMDTFLANPDNFLKKECIPDDIAKEIIRGDLIGMKLAANSFSKKRRKKTGLNNLLKNLKKIIYIFDS